MKNSSPLIPTDRSGLEKVLGLFTEVRSGEGLTALLLGVNVFLLLGAYYVIKPVREALILSGEGAEIKSYAAAGQAILLLFAVPLYAALASRVSRRILINSVTLFFGACLIVFYLLAQLEVPLGVIFYLWVGIFNLMVISQFWAFANDIYTPEQGKRLFALVAFGASSGAVFGSFITGRLIGVLGIHELMLVGAAVLGCSLVLTNWVDRRETRWPRHGTEGEAVQQVEAEPIGGSGAYQLLFSNRYLLAIAFLILMLNWVNTTGEYLLGRTVSEAAKAAVEQGSAGGLTVGAYIGKFYSDFFAVVNLAGMLTQLFVVSRILKYLGVRIALLILPMIALGGYAVLSVYPILGIVRWVKTAENSTDYSLQNTVRHVLFLPTSREEKYKAKQAIDSIFWRAGDVLSAVLVFVGTTMLSWGVPHFAIGNMVLVSVWIALAVWIGRENQRRVKAAEAGSEA